MTVSKRLRFEILRRDNHACRYCGGHRAGREAHRRRCWDEITARQELARQLIEKGEV